MPSPSAATLPLVCALFALGFLVIAPAQAATLCKMDQRSLRAEPAFGRYDVVLIGQVIDVFPNLGEVQYTVKVYRTLKGVGREEVMVTSGAHQCGISFQQDECILLHGKPSGRVASYVTDKLQQARILRWVKKKHPGRKFACKVVEHNILPEDFIGPPPPREVETPDKLDWKRH